MNGDYVVEGPADARPAEGGARLRVGIIGLGIGRMHIDGWRQHPQADVVAIADTDAARLAKVGDSHAIGARRRHLSAISVASTSPTNSAAVSSQSSHPPRGNSCEE